MTIVPNSLEYTARLTGFRRSRKPLFNSTPSSADSRAHSPPSDITKTPDSVININKPKVQGKNRGIERELEILFNQADFAGDKPFYYDGGELFIDPYSWGEEFREDYREALLDVDACVHPPRRLLVGGKTRLRHVGFDYSQ